MEKKTTYFRLIYLVGLIMVFLSFFLEWYSFKMVDFENRLLVSWSYYFFTSWQTPFSVESPMNTLMRPDNLPIPFIINIILMIVVIAAGYVVLFKNIDRAKIIKNYNKYAYVNIFLILLIGYYLIICPVVYLFPNELFFPLLSIRDYALEYVYIYAIGPGYILQIISFAFIFPYSVFYYKTTSSFIQQERTPEKLLEKTIQDSQESLDLDKYIAEEQLNQGEVVKILEEEVNTVLTTFMEGRKK
ncbi:MAG: hypothetical protein ACFE9C_04745 [Candidatus Hodarchaeota archaeon]